MFILEAILFMFEQAPVPWHSSSCSLDCNVYEEDKIHIKLQNNGLNYCKF